MAEDSDSKPTPSRNERKAIQTEIIEANKKKIESNKERFLSYSYSDYMNATTKNGEKPIERKTFRSFFSSKTTPNAETTMQLCQHFLGISYPEWLKEQKKNCDNENKCEYNPIYHWTGIKSFRSDKEPNNVIQEISNRICQEKCESNNIQATKEIWFYGTHFKFSLDTKEAEYRKILKNGFSLKFIINDYRQENIMSLMEQKFKEDPGVIKDNCEQCLGLIVKLMEWWKNDRLEQIKERKNIDIFVQHFSNKIQVRLHDNVASSKCYVVEPENEESISYIFPVVDRNKYYAPPVFICKNNPGGLVKANYLPGIKEIWDESRAFSLQDIQTLNEEIKKRIDLDIFNFYPQK